MSAALEKFFSTLATRANKENAVSDVLYAALSSVDKLYAIFAHKLALPRTPPARIVREYANGWCRPDFLLMPDSGTPVILEVKLFDTNYHYREYSQIRIDGAQPRIALLSAHQPIERLNGWDVLPWQDILHEMEQTTDDFILALAQFFREATMTEKLETIAFGRPKGMLYLNRALKHTIASYGSSKAICALNNGGKSFDKDCSGYYYSLTSISRPERAVYMWFGLTYDEEYEGIDLWVEKRWCSFYDEVRDALHRHYGSELYEDCDGCSIGIDGEPFDEFLSCRDLNTQLRTLTDTFRKFNGVIEQSL
jgi:hypothetical protein